MQTSNGCFSFLIYLILRPLRQMHDEKVQFQQHFYQVAFMFYPNFVSIGNGSAEIKKMIVMVKPFHL